jgi:hypothetical protein
VLSIRLVFVIVSAIAIVGRRIVVGRFGFERHPSLNVSFVIRAIYKARRASTDTKVQNIVARASCTSRLIGLRASVGPAPPRMLGRFGEGCSAVGKRLARRSGEDVIVADVGAVVTALVLRPSAGCLHENERASRSNKKADSVGGSSGDLQAASRSAL